MATTPKRNPSSLLSRISTSVLIKSSERIISRERTTKKNIQGVQDEKTCDIAERTISPVQTRLKLILNSCVRFATCFKTVNDMEKGRHREEDEVSLTTAMYNKRTVSHPKEYVGKQFNFISSLYLLCYLPKFQETFTPSTNRTSSNAGEKSTEGDKENFSCRRAGTKARKRICALTGG